MTNFSGAIKLADLNDFIAPSQACVVKLEDLKKEPLPQDLQETGVSIAQKPSKAGWSQTLPTQSEADPIKISLQDCLACSGCVTSAETVLLEHQSIGELKSKLLDDGVTVVISLSRQSIASLAAAYRLTPQQTADRLAACLRGLGAKAVFDAGTGRELALLEAAAEFLQRYRQANAHALAEDTEGNALEERLKSGSQASSRGGTTLSEAPVKSAKRKSDALPLLASACPGWICYAEKTHGDYVLPYISSTRSPQAVMGTLIKHHWAKQHNCEPSTIYHCSVMPCFDKKLEASREDFNLPGTLIPETDSVLTSIELQQLLNQEGIDLRNVPDGEMDPIFGGLKSRLMGLPGGSGGYAEYIFRAAAFDLFGVQMPDGPLPFKAIRNTDFRELALEVGGKVVLRFALAYGFRNIQTVLRKVKQGLSPYDYVEVMACPSGCVNGGGQIPPSTGSLLQSHIQEVDQLYHHPQIKRQKPEDSIVAQTLYKDWIKGRPLTAPAREGLHTAYHKREKSLTAAVKDW